MPASGEAQGEFAGAGVKEKPFLKQYEQPDGFANVILSWENIIAGQE